MPRGHFCLAQSIKCGTVNETFYAIVFLKQKSYKKKMRVRIPKLMPLVIG